MSSKSAEDMQSEMRALSEKAYEMGVGKNFEAFMSLAFLSLPVIPELKITDRGLFDVGKFELVSIEN